jgi:hypothetical protein
MKVELDAFIFCRVLAARLFDARDGVRKHTHAAQKLVEPVRAVHNEAVAVVFYVLNLLIELFLAFSEKQLY